VRNHLKKKFNCSLYQYYDFVQQALEAQGEIRQIPRSSPLLIEIAG